jgi:cell division septation protein DedD
VLIGTFASAARAATLEAAAKRAGFSGAKVVSIGDGAAASYAVRLGGYPSRDEAKKAGEQAEQRLGVAFRLAERP